MSRLILAVPSKGRLQEQASAFFADCGLKLAQDGGARGYSARMPALPELEVRLISAGDIARALVQGEVHVGVTGEDVIREAAGSGPAPIPVKPLGFGFADLVVAAPAGWLDVSTMADLAEVAALHRSRTGARLRVATKYMSLARAFFESHGHDDYRIVESAGATEGAPAAGVAEVIVDITTTGATLAANQLRPLSDGVILKSQAQLAAARTARWDEAALAALARILDAVEARGRAKAMRLVRAPLPVAMEAEALKLAARFGAIRAAEGPELAFYCPAKAVFAFVDALAGLKGGAIGVFEPDFIFARPNPVFEDFARQVNM